MAKSVSKNGEYFAVYKHFGGMDVTEGKSEGAKTSFAYTENMYRDYEGDFSESVESIPGFRTICGFGAKIHSIFMQKCSDDEEYIAVHAGTSLFRFNINDRDSLGRQTAIASLANTESHSFQLGTSLFVSDGEKIVKITSDGSVYTVGEQEGTVYVPTVFENGAPYEQRNLLTRKFKELFAVKEHGKYYRASVGLKYEFFENNGTCKIIGLKETHTGPLYIPRYAVFSDRAYKITEIAEKAFANHEGITEVHIADGLTSIGKLAFYKCKSLCIANCSSRVELIDNGAFLDCTSLREVYIGRNIKKFGMLPFSGDYSLEVINFEREEVDVSVTEGYNEISAQEKAFSVPRPASHYRTPIFTAYESIERVTLDDEALVYEEERGEDGGESSLYFTLPSDSAPEGRKILLSGTASAGAYNFYEEGTDFISRSGADDKVIQNCKTSALFDGRIFVAGNPNYPNSVFYSLKGRKPSGDALYFGTLSYFDDGMSAYKTVALSATQDSLSHLKGRDDGGGGIFYHEPKEAGDFLERVYPVSNIHTGINVKCGAVSQLDEVFFLSDMGAATLKKNGSGVQSVYRKSEKINPLLLKGKNLSDAHITSWLGYTVIQIKDEIFLADRRGADTNADDFDWYLITGLGTYKGQSAKCYYSEFAPDGLLVHKDAGKPARGPIYILNENEYGGFYYVKEGTNLYAVYLSGETEGGTFSPASCIFSDGKLLLFGVENGDLCLFNTDKRGVAPDRIRAMPDFDSEVYNEVMGNRIHPEFYSFAGRAPTYRVLTMRDDAKIPYFKKSVVSNSLSLCLYGIGTKDAVCEISADRNYKSEVSGLAVSAFNFSEIDFSAFDFDTVTESAISVLGGPKSFRELTISVSSSAFRSPISISEISYRYKIKGRLTRK